jgi:hypothetical protein
MMDKQEVSANSLVELREWIEFALSLTQLNPNDVFKKEQALQIVEAETKKSVAKGVRCLIVGIGEIISLTQDFVLKDLNSIDKLFLSVNLPTYSSMMTNYSKSIQRIIKRKKINSKKELELMQSYNGSLASNANRNVIDSIIQDYEQRTLNRI